MIGHSKKISNLNEFDFNLKLIYKLISSRANCRIQNPPRDLDICPKIDRPPFPVRNANDCTGYYLCSNGDLYPRECPRGQHFSPRNLRCESPAWVEF